MSQFRARLSDCPHGIDAGAYVLSALEEDESRAYAQHLTGCDHCRLEVDELRLVVDTLPISVPQTTPPPALKGRIMAVVNAEAELLRAADPAADKPVATKRRRWRPSFGGGALRPAFAGALACALLALGVAGGVLLTDSGDPETRTVSAFAEGPAQAQLAVTGENAALEVTDMPSLRSGEVYQVWLDRGDGQLTPSRTLFNVRSDGRAKIAIEEPVAGVQRILVSREPTGGSLAPSGAPVITASTT